MTKNIRKTLKIMAEHFLGLIMDHTDKNHEGNIARETRHKVPQEWNNLTVFLTST